MPRTSRVFAVLVAVSALLLGVLTSAASASAGPAADPPPSIAQLCAATGDQSVDALLAGVSDTDLVGALAPLLTLTVPQNQGRVLKADVDLADVRTALGCTNSTTTSTAPPTSTSTAPRDQRDCSDFATQQAAQAFYDSVATPDDPDPSNLDADGDGKACEPGERGSGSSNSGSGPSTATQDDGSTATTNGGQIVDVPEGSASTGE